VRTLSVKPPRGAGVVRLVRIGEGETPVDLQPCGGTHVRATGEIGTVTVTKLESKGKQNRRVYLMLEG
jgi:misacylated tRNA(Ala) deacylase